MDSKKSESIKDGIVAVALLLMLAMAALPIFNINEEWMRWVYAAGAGITLLVRFTQRYTGKSLRGARLYRLNTVAAILFCVSAALTFYRKGTGDWLAFLLAGAVMQIYVAFSLDRVKAKESAGKK